ncbi:uncharacterized protein LOC114558561 [Perca flavescens]|uniref:uncharacterized protein LOC114558561 n=1 Tax=Perca flavescens TaxID=8167 RepID=UPI00106E2E61|nr:uncharacterized protein LOC114558561 [Perca flavescens]
MLCFRLSTTLLLAATCSLMTAGNLSDMWLKHTLTYSFISIILVVSTEKAITCGSDGNVQHLSCDDGVISVQTALYGRADAVTCSEGRPPAQLANTNCSQAGTVDVVKKRCDGKRVCELNINVFYTSDPCYGTYKYLETKYTCLPAIHLDACEGSLAKLQCDQGQVIFVYGADYGRRDQTTCIYQRPLNQIQNIYCSSPTRKVADSCNGKNSCTIAASNSVFGDPCVNTYKYLEVAYICDCKYLKGSSITAYRCVSSSQHLSYCSPQTGSSKTMLCFRLSTTLYDGVISVQTALYGRADAVTCSEGRPPAQLANTHCSQAGTVDVVKKRCDGKRVCELNINVFYTSDPCYGTYKYLETKYTCLPAIHLDACEGSLAKLQCDQGQVIFVYGADYGRRDQTTCIYKRPPSQVQNIYCSSPTRKVADSCNGKNSCTIAASNSVFGDPCVGTYKYLEVAYICYCCPQQRLPNNCQVADVIREVCLRQVDDLQVAVLVHCADLLNDQLAGGLTAGRRLLLSHSQAAMGRSSPLYHQLYDGVISVQTALYGQGYGVNCIEGRPLGVLSLRQCSQAGTVDVLKKRCDGKTECELNINVFHTSDPCYGIYTNLDTTYTCIHSIHLVACEGSFAQLQCDQGQVISVNGANYGRSDQTTCIYQRPLNQINDISCSSPTPKVAASCNGQNSCTIAVNDSVFGDPCVGTYKYLKVDYTCKFTSDPCYGIFKYLDTTYTCFPTLHLVACEGSLAQLQCDQGQVIFVYNANYGRLDQTTCIYQRPPEELQNIQCLSPAPEVADSCNGENSCTIAASNFVFGDPCYGTYKYLEVVYICECKYLKVPFGWAPG